MKGHMRRFMDAMDNLLQDLVVEFRDFIDEGKVDRRIEEEKLRGK